MIQRDKCFRIVCYVARKYSTNIKPKVIPDENVLKDIENEVYKPRKHPGIFQPRVIIVPDAFVKAVNNVLEDYPVKALIQDGAALSLHLKGKMPPTEKDQVRKNIMTVKERVLSQMKPVDVDSEQAVQKFKQTVNDRVKIILKKEFYNWKPVNYDTYNCLVYLMARSAPEYAVLVKIFSEIAGRDPNFKPRSLFDFGSGVGTVSWAANLYWKNNFFEYFNVDASVEMNDLAQILLQNGRGTNTSPLKGVFYRQFLPASHKTYDLVVSAYSLLELPSRKARLETILNLWNKTQQYLVVVEQGTNAGFKIINEVRDFILHTQTGHKTMGHIFSPCPHDEACPRFVSDDNTPCNFEINYHTLPVGANSVRRSERYCYIVFKKGERDGTDPRWPRVVRETLIRSKHAICRMCTKNGQLEEVIFTGARHGKAMYYCAKATRWGDLLPITLEKNAKISGEGE